MSGRFLGALRASVFYASGLVTAALVCTLLVLAWPLAHRVRYRIGRLWTDWNLWVLRRVCGIQWRVRGTEQIPPGPGVVMAKHQSAWETMALQHVFPRQVWVLKRELLWIPLFGWGLAMLDPVAVDRRGGYRALKEMIRQGRERLADGAWVVVFPEGTRVAPGEHRPYQPGGAMLATQAQVPVVPVAHNAGLYWPRNGFLKRPGIIELEIGPPIDPRGMQPAEVNAAAQAWIETTTARLVGAAQ